MKALEFLQGIVELDENKYHGGRVVEFSSEDFKYMQEAIAELEALAGQLAHYKKLANELNEELTEANYRLAMINEDE